LGYESSPATDPTMAISSTLDSVLAFSANSSTASLKI